MVDRIMIAGIGTEVGKTIVSAILSMLFNADYWKPIQCGDEETSDTSTVRKWLDTTKHVIHPSIYSLKAPLSPHHAARLENRFINLDSIIPPYTTRPLIIEGVGGVLVPLTINKLAIDLFALWNCKWVIVSKHYLGSINHTLLTIESLKQRQIPILGIIFNGEPNFDSESIILEMSQVPMLGRLLPEMCFTSEIFQTYVKQWQPQFSQLLL